MRQNFEKLLMTMVSCVISSAETERPRYVTP